VKVSLKLDWIAFGKASALKQNVDIRTQNVDIRTQTFDIRTRSILKHLYVSIPGHIKEKPDSFLLLRLKGSRLFPERLASFQLRLDYPTTMN